MGYIQELRALVGHRPVILATAGVLILDEQGRLLLQRRSDDGRWGIPGGALELGESTEEAARREVCEETGLTAGKMALFGIFSGAEFFAVYPNGDQAFIVSVMYVTQEASGDLRTDQDESLELRYFTRDELLTADLSPVVTGPVIRQMLHDPRLAAGGSLQELAPLKGNQSP